MSSSVDVSDRTKSRLERLQAEIQDETGYEVSQRELLDRLVAREYDSKTERIEEFRDEMAGLSEDEIDAFLSGTFSSGTETDEEDIDEILYGE
jgi:hypothetical protein